MKQLPMGDVEFRSLARITRELEFFRSFNGAQAERFLSRIGFYAFDKGETIFEKDTVSNALYLIHEGHVRIFLGYRMWGLIKKFANLHKGDLFGEISLFLNQPHRGTAVAQTSTQLFVLFKEDFDKLMSEDREFADLVQFIVSRRTFESQH